jgi:hypothetical protein
VALTEETETRRTYRKYPTVFFLDLHKNVTSAAMRNYRIIVNGEFGCERKVMWVILRFLSYMLPTREPS